MAQNWQYRPGFRGSETSWVDAVIYQRTDDPIVVSDGKALRFSGRRISDTVPALVSASVDKTLGATGSFSLVVKASIALLELLVDDAWVDLIWYRHDQPWHVMRGLLDTVRRSHTVVNGATVETYTLTGRDFQKVFELTPAWFSPYAGADLVSSAIAFQVFNGIPEVIGDPGTVITAYLKKFLEEVGHTAGVNWWPPAGMEGAIEGDFIGSVTFNTDYFQNFPARKAFNPNFLQPDGTLWSLAKQHSDPAFTELYCDLLPDGDPFSRRIEAGDPLTPADTQMTVVLRDRPFPVVDSEVTSEYIDAWDDLPRHWVARQEIQTIEVSRGGLERFNTYFAASMLAQETLGRYGLSIMAPLVDLEDIKRHGMRRCDVQSAQVPDGLDMTVMADQQRRLMRDWYCLNPYFLSGTVALGIGRPDIKVGSRLIVPGALGDSQNENYYIQSVSHNWTFGRGSKTGLGVTRGWVGKDSSLREAVRTMSSRYTVVQKVDESIFDQELA